MFQLWICDSECTSGVHKRLVVSHPGPVHELIDIAAGVEPPAGGCVRLVETSSGLPRVLYWRSCDAPEPRCSSLEHYDLHHEVRSADEKRPA